ncbi:MAG: aminopeptidase N [Galactobacter sp.]
MPGLNLTRVEASERAALVDTQSYDVHLDLTDPGTTFRAVTTARFSATEGASTFIDSVTRQVHSVTLNGQALDPSAVADGVRIQLDGLAAENELVVDATLDYSTTGEGLHRFVDPEDCEVYLYSQFEVPDTRRMFTVFEQPDLKATFTFTVDTPAHWDAISNQPTPEPTTLESGAKRFAFTATPQLAPYVTALVAGPYVATRSEVTSADGRRIPLGVFTRKSLAKYMDPENIFEVTAQGFEFFEEQFGAPYPFEKYDQLFVPEFNAGAMENAGCVTILEDYVFRSKVSGALIERRAITVLHELAHMWFGDLVTMKWWNDLWLNESFAEFMSHLAADANTTFTTAWTTFSSVEKSWAYVQDQLPSTHPIKAEIRDLEDVQVNFDGITYAKGASVLRQLVAWVGQEEFMAGVREYFKKHAFGNTELRDLMVELEASSGRDLAEWSQQWLESAGVNVLRPVVETDADGVITAFSVAQEAPAEHPILRAQHIGVGFYDLSAEGKLVRTYGVDLDVDGASTAVADLVGRKRPDLILVNDGDLGYAKLRLDQASLDFAIEHLRDFEDSLARALVWGAAWDATRDGEIPARAYVDLVLNNIDAETEPSVVRTQLNQLSTALGRYVAADAAEATSGMAAQRLWDLAQTAEAGSDNQFQFVMKFSALASTAEHLDVIAALRSRAVALDGLEIDDDLSWELLTSLVAGGRVGEAEIAAALEADPSSSGELAATIARAAIPTAEAKAAAWASVVEQNTLSNTFQRRVITGFNRVHDVELIKPYVESYFAAVPGLWKERSYEMAQTIVNGLYPVKPTSEATLEATDALLNSLGEDTPALVRLLVEARAGMERAVAAQAVDAAVEVG